MPHKKKILRHKLRLLQRVKNAMTSQTTSQSKSDILLSSMESLIRKISMAPTPSTIITQPAPAQTSKEVSKEEIMVDIAKQKELNMLKNQVQYMYSKIDEDIVVRRDKGEVMARMMSKGTKVQPKEFNVNTNDELFKFQQQQTLYTN